MNNNTKVLLILEELPEVVNFYMSKDDINSNSLEELKKLHGKYFNASDYETTEEDYEIYSKTIENKTFMTEHFIKLSFPINLDNNCQYNVIHVGFYM
jgi:hypothetical protein